MPANRIGALGRYAGTPGSAPPSRWRRRGRSRTASPLAAPRAPPRMTARLRDQAHTHTPKPTPTQVCLRALCRNSTPPHLPVRAACAHRRGAARNASRNEPDGSDRDRSDHSIFRQREREACALPCCVRKVCVSPVHNGEKNKLRQPHGRLRPSGRPRGFKGRPRPSPWAAPPPGCRAPTPSESSADPMGPRRPGGAGDTMMLG